MSSAPPGSSPDSAPRAPWLPDREVDENEARGLIERHFPALTGARLERFGVGWDNVAYLVHHESEPTPLVFRFPQRVISAPLMQRELKVLSVVRERLPLPTPDARFAFLGDEDEWAFGGYPLLPGRTIDTLRAPLEVRAAWIEPLLRFLQALHAITEREARALGAEDDPIGRFEYERRRVRLFERLSDLDGTVVDSRPGRVDELRALIADTPPRSPGAVCLVHGDLHPENLLVDGAPAALVGVIDWGDVHVGDPAVDLSLVFGLLEPSDREEFRRRYGADAGTWRRARWRAAEHTTAFLASALDQVKQPLADELVGALDRILAD